MTSTNRFVDRFQGLGFREIVLFFFVDYDFKDDGVVDVSNLSLEDHLRLHAFEEKRCRVHQDQH